MILVFFSRAGGAGEDRHAAQKLYILGQLP
jgi:hypothetical protein